MPREPTGKPEDRNRLNRIIEWLRRNKTRVEKPDRVQLTFNCAGGRICTEIKEGGEA